MIEVRQTTAFSEWFDGLRDRQARARINIRIRHLSLGNPGNVKLVGEGVSELQIDHGPGYRVYCRSRAAGGSTTTLADRQCRDRSLFSSTQNTTG